MDPLNLKMLMIKKVKFSKSILILCLMLLILPAPSSWSFEKQAHVEISKMAVQLYGEMNPSRSDQIKIWTSPFIDGSGREDDYDLFHWQRLFNWHFYDPGSRLGHAWWGASKANTNRFTKLAERLTESGVEGTPETYELAGRLVHHIQDMSSPPHTVPIYHLDKDPFDKYATAEIAGVRLTSAQVDAVKGEQGELNRDALRKLLKDAAERTIARIGEPVRFDGRVIADDWTGFWRKYELIGAECGQEPSNNFGCYGNNTFGIETGPFTKDVYKMFYKERIASAIQDTLRLLILLEKIPAGPR